MSNAKMYVLQLIAQFILFKSYSNMFQITYLGIICLFKVLDISESGKNK
jgi:type III secretory pathway component EscU